MFNSEFANVGFSRYPDFIPNSIANSTQFAVENCNRETVFDISIAKS